VNRYSPYYVPYSQARLVHRGTSREGGVPIGRRQPDDGRAELEVTCAVCAQAVPVAVLSVRAIRRHRVRLSLLCFAAAVGLAAVGAAIFIAGAKTAGFLVGAGLMVPLLVLAEGTGTLDDGVRVLEKPRRHEIDRPGWDTIDSGGAEGDAG
jgi:hypothetical protein